MYTNIIRNKRNDALTFKVKGQGQKVNALESQYLTKIGCRDLNLTCEPTQLSKGTKTDLESGIQGQSQDYSENVT